MASEEKPQEKPVKHEKAEKKCTCTPTIGRHIYCQIHGDRDKI